MPENKPTHSEHSEHSDQAGHAAHPEQKPSSSATTYTLITEPDQGLTAIYNLISSAKKSIDMTMYELTDITVASSLTKAAAAGVTVRVILDQSGSEKQTNTPA
jgi:phosphatidylserine/phosphatidylglycerophosphate/cardiolipin synthase-like enzyme